jgi:hypothetical protein
VDDGLHERRDGVDLVRVVKSCSYLPANVRAVIQGRDPTRSKIAAPAAANTEASVVDRRREWLLGSLTVALTLAAGLVVAEVVLRFLPVASGTRTLAVNAQNPVFHFTPNRDFTFSTGWNMELAHRGHMNNVGFVNDQDYDKDDARPLLAVVGDSMIEAAMVPYRETLHGRSPRRSRASCGSTVSPLPARPSVNI